MKVLLACGNRDLLNTLCRVLLANNYEVMDVFDGVQILDNLHRDNYDALIVDENIPRIRYDKLIKQIRDEDIKIPVLLIVHNVHVPFVVLSESALADEYLTSPFHVNKLLYRLENIIAMSKQEKEELTVGNTVLSNKFYYVKAQEKVSHLSTREYLILRYFFMNEGKELTYQDILSSISKKHVDLNLLWIYVAALNKKLEDIAAGVAIEDISEKGYKLVKRND